MSTIALENARKIQDASFIANVTVATNVTVNTASFNLIQTYAASEHYAIECDLDANVTVPSTATVIVNLQDSADNITFANIPTLGGVTLTGNTSNVIAAASLSTVFRLPPVARQYVRGTVVGGALGAAPTGNVSFGVRY